MTTFAAKPVNLQHFPSDSRLQRPLGALREARAGENSGVESIRTVLGRQQRALAALGSGTSAGSPAGHWTSCQKLPAIQAAYPPVSRLPFSFP